MAHADDRSLRCPLGTTINLLLRTKPTRTFMLLTRARNRWHMPRLQAATWLGHASVLTQWDGWNILADPLLSERCSPLQWVGHKRFRPPPLSVEELPDIDVVVISHTHYDHLDSATVTALAERTPSPLFFVPLGTAGTPRHATHARTHARTHATPRTHAHARTPVRSMSYSRF